MHFMLSQSSLRVLLVNVELEYSAVTTMAYMSVMKGLDEKAKRKDVDGVFMKLDKNQNGVINF